MANDFFNASGNPPDGGEITSPQMRSEFSAIAAGFDKLPALTGGAYEVVYVNASGTALDSFGGSGLLKLSASGAPSIAVAGTDYVTLAGTEALTNKTINGVTITASTGTLSITSGKTLSALKTLTLTGTDGTTHTLPATDSTLARTDAAQTFTGDNRFSGNTSFGTGSPLAYCGVIGTFTAADTASEYASYQQLAVTATSGTLAKYGSLGLCYTAAGFGGGGGAGFTGALVGTYGSVSHNLASPAVVNTAYGLYSGISNMSTGTITTAVGVFFGEPVNASGTITNVRGFQGSVSAGTNKYNLYMSGTAPNYFAGNVGVGAIPSSDIKHYVAVAGDNTLSPEYAIYSQIAVGMTSGSAAKYANQSIAYTTVAYAGTGSLVGSSGVVVHNGTGATAGAGGLSGARGVQGFINNADVGTIIDAANFYGSNALNPSGAITRLYGYFSSDLTAGSTSYAFHANTTAGTNRWNFYANGTAPNYFAGNVTANAAFNQTPTRSTVAAGSTITLTTATNHLLYDNAATAATLTITLPSASLTDGQTITIATRSAITTLTLNGGTIYGAPATLAAGGFASFIYSSAAAAWFRKG